MLVLEPFLLWALWSTCDCGHIAVAQTERLVCSSCTRPPLCSMQPSSALLLLQRRLYMLNDESTVRLLHYHRAGNSGQQASQAPASGKRKTPEPGDDEQASW